MGDSGTLPICPLCHGVIRPYGRMKSTFVPEDLMEPICLDCARKVVPAQVAVAEELERRWSDQDPERGS